MGSTIFEAQSLEDILTFKESGFDIKTISESTEIPGGTLLHFFSAKANLEIVQYLLEEEQFDVNAMDTDKCTPLGYLMNKELLYFLDKGVVCSVNNYSEKPYEIISTINYLRSLDAKCIYLGYEYDEKFILSYLEKLNKYK